MGNPFLFPPALALPNEKRIEQLSDDAHHWSPALIFTVRKSQKTKVQFVSETPLSVALFCRTQPVCSASPSWIIAFFRTGGQLWHKEKQKGGEPEGWGLLKQMWVGLQPLSGQPGFPSLWPGCPTAGGGERLSTPPPSASKALLLPSLSRMALPFSAAHIPGRARGRKDPVERNGEGRARDPLARGILSASSLILWIVHPSAHCEDGEAECPTAVQ